MPLSGSPIYYFVVMFVYWIYLSMIFGFRWRNEPNRDKGNEERFNGNIWSRLSIDIVSPLLKSTHFLVNIYVPIHEFLFKFNSTCDWTSAKNEFAMGQRINKYTKNMEMKKNDFLSLWRYGERSAWRDTCSFCNVCALRNKGQNDNNKESKRMKWIENKQISLNTQILNT